LCCVTITRRARCAGNRASQPAGRAGDGRSGHDATEPAFPARRSCAFRPCRALRAVLGLLAVEAAPRLNGYFLGFAAGAMTFVSLHELVPMARRYGHLGW